MPGVFIGCPTYGEEINTGTATGIWQTATRRDDVRIVAATRSGSLIPGSCNVLWSNAINYREEHGLTHFAMLHADIEPEQFWIDKLLEIIEQTQADMLSVCVPIKDDRGLVSTGIAGDDERLLFCRLTQRQIWHRDFPESFDIDQCADALESLPDGLRVPNAPRIGLRLNTGCMIIRMDRPWVGCDPATVYFENLDWIEKHKGQWRARDFSEDFRFSQRVQQAGGRLVATRAVKVVHKGLAGFPNDRAWGLLQNDADVLAELKVA